MSKAQYQRRNQARLARLEIVSQLYLRGNSVRKIRAEVMRRLDLATYSTQTVHADIRLLLQEWHESRLDNVNDALQLELIRIDETICELWDQWEKSKQDYVKTTRKRKGAPARRNQQQDGGEQAENNPNTIQTLYTEEQSAHIQGLGNPAYIAEIRQQLAERRKLLGLYSAEKRVIKTTIAKEISREELEQELRRLELLTD